MEVQPPKTLFLLIYREDVPGLSWKVFSSLSTLTRLLENIRDDPDHYDYGPFDVFVIDLETPEIAPYDIAPIQKLTKRKKAAVGR